MQRKLTIHVDRFPLAQAFVISRGAKTEAIAVRVHISGEGGTGSGECIPYARYDETPESVVAALEGVRAAVERGCDRDELQGILPAGAARNALDCALWDLDAKRLGIRASQIAGLHRIAPAVTAYTLSAGTPECMGAQAASQAHRPILKIKLAGDGDKERVAAVRESAPDSEIIADANEGWRKDQVEELLGACADMHVALVEQPLPAGQDAMLASIDRVVPVCADESAHTSQDLAGLSARYDAVNIKLDKAGGLTEALLMARKAQELGFTIMVGSMVGSSLSMAPAMLLAPFARWLDLDGPLLLAKDREPGLRYEGSIVYPPEPALWG